MGIPHYFHILVQQYPGILLTKLPVDVCDFFLDFNGVVHTAANKVLSESTPEENAEDIDKKVMEETWMYFERCVRFVKPSHRTHICMDGVAPVAKMIQQRKRRYMSVFKNELDQRKVTWDRNAISPGTPFMAKLHANIRSQMRASASTLGNIFFSSSDEVGEGEQKIFSRLPVKSEKPVLIHGLDADLIMLSLISHHPSIYLMREPTGPYAEVATENGFLYVHIHSLRHAILEDLKVRVGWQLPEDIMQDIYSEVACLTIESYVILCFLLGNDFLPHIPTLSLKKQGHDKILWAAKQHWYEGASLVEGDCFQYALLTKIITTLSQQEETDIVKMNNDYIRKKAFTSEKDPNDSYPLQYKDPVALQIANEYNRRWRAYYYKELFHSRLHDTTVIAHSCREFLKGMEWTYRYYRRLPKPSRWYYPYAYGPTLKDLANFYSGWTASDAEALQTAMTEGPLQGFVIPSVQLACIMPVQSSGILPAEVRNVMTSDSLGCTDLFPRTFKVHTYLHTHLWECSPILPILDIPRLERAFQRKKVVMPSTTKQYKVAKPFTFKI